MGSRLDFLDSRRWFVDVVRKGVSEGKINRFGRWGHGCSLVPRAQHFQMSDRIHIGSFHGLFIRRIYSGSSVCSLVWTDAIKVVSVALECIRNKQDNNRVHQYIITPPMLLREASSGNANDGPWDILPSLLGRCLPVVEESLFRLARPMNSRPYKPSHFGRIFAGWSNYRCCKENVVVLICRSNIWTTELESLTSYRSGLADESSKDKDVERNVILFIPLFICRNHVKLMV